MIYLFENARPRTLQWWPLQLICGTSKPNQAKPNNAYLTLHDKPFWKCHTKGITKVTSAADLCDLRPAMKSKSLFKYVIPTILGYIRTIGDSQNLIAPFTIIREMCPDHSVKYRNLIFWLFSRVDLRHLEWFFEKIAESRPPLFFNFRGGLKIIVLCLDVTQISCRGHQYIVIFLAFSKRYNEKG